MQAGCFALNNDKHVNDDVWCDQLKPMPDCAALPQIHLYTPKQPTLSMSFGIQEQKQLINGSNIENQQLEYESLKFDETDESQTSPFDTVMDVVNDDDEKMLSADNFPVVHAHHPPSVDYPRDDQAIFGFSRLTYMNSLRMWSARGKVVEGYEAPPHMVRADSGSLSNSDADDTMSNSSGGSDDDDAGNDNTAVPKGVTFNETVRVMPIPPISAYTDEQRFRMYANRFELRENKVRNKKEFQFDGYDWRNATEEAHMAICPMSGELLHPAHL